MKILLIGATGTIGSAVATALEAERDEVVRVGRTGGEHTLDLEDAAGIAALYDVVGPVDAVVCAAGVARFGAVQDLDVAAYESSVANKLMGQVNLVRLGIGQVRDGGSFTLTSGTLSVRPTPGTAAVAMVGGALESFARAAALDMGDRYRINVVSPGWVAESRQAMGLEPMPGIWAADLARVYVDIVHGAQTGRVIEAEASPGA